MNLMKFYKFRKEINLEIMEVCFDNFCFKEINLEEVAKEITNNKFNFIEFKNF